MIKVVKENNYIKLSGHAKSDLYGNDIVCASLSSIVYTTVNGILNIDKEAIKFIDEKDFEIIINKDDFITKTLIDNMLKLLEEIAIKYPKNIKIISKGE